MSGKTYKTTETPGGIGEVRKAGVHVAKVFYRLTVRREIIPGEAAGAKESYGAPEISGEVSVSQDEPNQSQVLKSMGSGELLTLHLEDGRRLDIHATKGEGYSDAFRIVASDATGFVAASQKSAG